MEQEVRAYVGWHKVNEFGYQNRVAVANIMCQSKAGIVTFLPSPNHTDAQPNKMFEYMSSGIPIITSDFPLWREIVEGNHCGICVNPLDPIEIANAINYIIRNVDSAELMGINGQRAIKEKYNWEVEEEKLKLSND